MGLIGSLIGIGLGMATIGTACDVDDKRRGFMTSTERDRYDQLNARNGINVNDVEHIARRCKVKSSEFGVLPADGWYKCLDYVRKYANSSNDVPAFINAWEATIKRQLAAESDKVKESDLASRYPAWSAFAKNHAKEMDRNNPLTFEITHWRKLRKDLHASRVEDIATNTSMQHILAQPPVLRWSSVVPDTRAEFWTIYGKPGQTVDFSTKRDFKTFYKICCAHCGYDPKL